METRTKRVFVISREVRSETCADRLHTCVVFVPHFSTREETAIRWQTRQMPGQRLLAARVGLRCRLL
jgi:hypothetical protein